MKSPVLAALAVAIILPSARGAEPAAAHAGYFKEIVYGQPDCCCECQAGCPCRKRTRIVCETAKATSYKWLCESEDYCTLNPRKKWAWSWPSVLCGKTGRDAANDCGECVDGASLERPIAGRCRTARKLIKKEYTEEIPAYTCVVEYRCPDCAAAVSPPPGDAPPAQAPATKPAYIADRRSSDVGYGE